jgi:hypothetical protein
LENKTKAARPGIPWSERRAGIDFPATVSNQDYFPGIMNFFRGELV